MQIIQAPRASAILYSLLVGRADRRPWLLPANICPIVPITFLKAETPFEFVDISDGTLHMDLEQAEGRLERGDYGGLLYAHTYAESSTPGAFFAAVKERYPQLLLMDDRCLCIPELEPDLGTAADVSLYSTGYAKIVELNFGGYAFIKDTVPFELAHLPFDPNDYQEIESSYKKTMETRTFYTYRDSDWLETDRHLPSWHDYRRQIESGLRSSLKQRGRLNAVYAAHLPAEIQLPGKYQTWRFNIRVQEKSRLLAAIFAGGLFASSHYASLAGIMAAGRAPLAENLAGEIVNLFNDHHFTVEQARQVCRIILETLP